MPVSFAPSQRPRTARAGFSLVELMITLVLLAIVVAVVATVMISSQRSKADTEGRIEAQQSGRAISDMIAADIRTAGYGVDVNTIPNQPAFAYVDSVEIMINVNQLPFPDTSGTYIPTALTPQVLNPTGTPMPHKLSGSYLPPAYAGGAETIVYTLDLNNDGVVDASDQAAALAVQAQRTGNPNDYVLARAVYGQVAAGNNGGSLSAVGLVRGPGAGIPPLYSVYLNGSSTPWNWHSGPVPAAQLKNITSIQLQVTTEGRRARSDGTYPRSTLTTEINSIRNQPTVSTTLMAHVTGFVFNDTNKDHVKNGVEAGIPNVLMRLGSVAVGQTSSTGFFDLSGPLSQYVLKQVVPSGFFANGPDSFAVDLAANPGGVAHDFPDTTRVGGWVNDTCYVDANLNGILDAGDTTRVDGATISCAGASCMTGADGGSQIFVPTGAQSIAIAPPDSFSVVGTNPVPLTITNGSTTTIYTRMAQTGTGTVTGFVFLDLNKNGTMDAGESAVPNAWVGVVTAGGATTLGYGYTNSLGAYSVVVPNNMPAATQPYTVMVIPPDGYYPTGTTTIAPVWVYTGGTYPNNNFGMVNYTSISLLADRVLALGTANLLEFDWTGNVNQWASKGSYDEDLILCSEYVSNPNISVWFNHMSEGHPTVFDSTFSYQVNAQSNALCIATGSIDTAGFLDREDAVTGLAYKATGNIAVWITGNSPTGNCGFFATTPTLYSSADAGDVQQVKLQDCAGGSSLDMIVGTKSPTAYHGTLEVWRGKGDGTFVRDEIYPNAGNLPGNTLGEVRALDLKDVTGDGVKDLIVGTKTGDGTGKLHIMQFVTKTNGNRYRAINNYDVVGEVTSLITTDVDGDGRMDIVLGTRITASTGNVQYWKGNGSGGFTLMSTFVAPGPVLCLAAGDLGGTSRNDIIYGFRTNESVFTGGVRILYTDLGTLPPDDVDPAGGTSNFMTTSIAAWNFNYEINPSVTPGPYYTDLVVAQKPTATTGRLFYFQR